MVETILIVDDIEQNRYLLNAMLQGMGYAVVEASNGLEALEKARLAPPSLVISDILMPTMDGYTLCRQWKREPLLRQIPFVFYTATYTEPKDKKLALGLGAERFLVKPLEPDIFMTEIRGVMAESAAKQKEPEPSSATVDASQDSHFYKEYSSVLISKLEDKVAQLERSNRNLEETIGELRHTERQLRKSQFLLQSIVDGISEPLILLDHDTTIKMVNQAAIRYFGMPADEIIGHSCHQLHRHMSAECTDCEITRYIDKPQPSIIERKSCLFPDRFEQVSIYPLQAFPDDAGSAIIRIADVTDAKRLQEHLLQQEKLASVGELAAGVAHEINNPINGIMNYAQLLIDEHQVKENTVDFPQRILSEADRVVRIIRNLLSFARQSDDDVAEIDLRTFLINAIQLVEKQLLGDGITLSLEIPETFPLLRGNGHKMQQVFLNLLSNARYALNMRFHGYDPAKVLTISANVRKEEEKDWLIIQFSDNGIGIPEKIIHRVCDPFFSTKPRGEGSGLGLSISYGIVKEHGGKLVFSSAVDKGTTVTIALPLLKVMDDPETGAH